MLDQNLLEHSATDMAAAIARRDFSSTELVRAHLEKIENLHPALNAAVIVFEEAALAAARKADESPAKGPLHGVPFSIKDSIDVAGSRTTAGTLGRRDAQLAERDATVVARLRAAGAIPIAKTNLPDLLFSFETDNLIFGRTNNPYDRSRTPGGSSGGESALIAACGSPLGLGSDCLGSVRLPAAFCGIASIKPTSGRIPKTGHVPAAGMWFEPFWQIGPMARHVEDLQLAMQLLAYADEDDFRSPPVPLAPARELRTLRGAFFTANGFAPCTQPVADAVLECAKFLEVQCTAMEERRPPCLDQAYDIELALLGADNAKGIEAYLRAAGSNRIHRLHTAFIDQMRARRTDMQAFAGLWVRWDDLRAQMNGYFREYDFVLCPVYPTTALNHGESAIESNFRGFSYTMPWNLTGTPAATVRCAESNRLPVNVQIVTRPWDDMTALAIARAIETQFGGWKPV